MTEKRLTIATQQDGLRLDRVLGELLPDTGLRHRRRLCDEGVVTVNGRPAKSSLKLREGMDVRVVFPDAEMPSPDELGLYVIDIQDDLAAVYKPEGMHTAAIVGRGNASVEAMLPQLFPGRDAMLLNRLDNPTSGLVAVALTQASAARYHAAEEAGRITKEYAAVVSGHFEGKVTVRNALDTSDRKTTRVLAEDSEDSTRWTEVEAVSHHADRDMTTVVCRIRKGARHQIRAHLASLDHPIVGDIAYGGPEASRLHLHHQRFSLGDVVFEAPCSFV